MDNSFNRAFIVHLQRFGKSLTRTGVVSRAVARGDRHDRVLAKMIGDVRGEFARQYFGSSGSSSRSKSKRLRDFNDPNAYGTKYENTEVCDNCGHLASFHANTNGGQNCGPCSTPNCSCSKFTPDTLSNLDMAGKVSGKVTSFKRLAPVRGGRRGR
jgi:hypothetical protein